MHPFIQHHGPSVIGVVSGFDRLRFRGTLRWLYYTDGMAKYLSRMRVLLKNFKQFVEGVTNQIREAVTQGANAGGRPLTYLASSAVSKEDVARQLAERDDITQGLICVLSCVEPCWSYCVNCNSASGQLELQRRQRKCLHYYHYCIHPQFGFMHTRLQTWFPFDVHVCINGREWLARQMDAAKLSYVRQDNCFVDIADIRTAQKLMDRQLRVNWVALLDRLDSQFHAVRKILKTSFGYYWTIAESEWATDVMFRSPALLAQLYPRLIRHGMENLTSREVLRFLGKRVPAAGGVNQRFSGEVVSDLRERPEGLRIKHRVNRNSIKMYDKQGSVLRVETTLNDPYDLMVYRPKEKDPGGQKSWRPLRRGVADTYRRAQVCQATNDRYLASLATVEDSTPLGDLARKLCRPVKWKGKRVRALNPLATDDAALLQAVNRGEFLLNGFRNKDLRELLFGPDPTDLQERRRRSAAVTRKIRLLRAHGLTRKVPKSHRYMVSAKGQTRITALLTARKADTAKLARAA